VGAHYSPGVHDVSISAPIRLGFRRCRVLN